MSTYHILNIDPNSIGQIKLENPLIEATIRSCFQYEGWVGSQENEAAQETLGVENEKWKSIVRV